MVYLREQVWEGFPVVPEIFSVRYFHNYEKPYG